MRGGHEGETEGHHVIIIAELKSVRRAIKTHEVQLFNYWTATNIQIGLLLNFAEQKVEVKRRVRKLPTNATFDMNSTYPLIPVDPVKKPAYQFKKQQGTP